ncbi:uncharacterized protein C1orf50 homolog [Lasioglossum baleicum]|uniref:uncharacterized protein C1orf50 homolog n=1 Tax=Lasioglossum baleicum TaxID=434251 RepID=UPI003FCEC3A1
MDYSNNSHSKGLHFYTEECNVVQQDKQSKQQDTIPRIAKSLLAQSQQEIVLLSRKLGLLNIELTNLLAKWANTTDMDQVACNFVKRPGHVYHLYYKRDHRYFSMLSPEEWGSSGPAQIYIGSYKLESNYFWTCVRNNVSILS